MANPLIQDWNNSPPPTAEFLEQLGCWREAVAAADLNRELKAYDSLMDAIATRQDLAQFLLEACGHIWCQDIENRTVDRYWDALAGALVADADKAGPNTWSALARTLDKALWYE